MRSGVREQNVGETFGNKKDEVRESDIIS